MAYLLSTRRLVDALKAEGFPLPDDCAEARLVMRPADTFMIEYRVFVSEENLRKFGRALQRIADESWRPGPRSGEPGEG